MIFFKTYFSRTCTNVVIHLRTYPNRFTVFRHVFKVVHESQNGVWLHTSQKACILYIPTYARVHTRVCEKINFSKNSI